MQRPLSLPHEPQGQPGAVSTLRRAVLDASWLTADRARAYGLIAAIGSMLFAAGLAAIFIQGARQSPSGLSFSCDFNAFWSAARLAWNGHPGAAWVPERIRAMQAVNAQPIAGGGYIAYPYPPVFQLLTLPLGALPFRTALPLFLVGGIAAFTLAIRPILPATWPVLSIGAAPAIMVDAASTQNGWITASLFALAIRFLERRPSLAGVLLGVLAFKPQMALCVPLGLAAARRWRALLGFAASVAALCALSYAVLGAEAWQGFIHSIPLSRAIGQTRNNWGTGQSLYAALRILGAASGPAFAIQGAASVAALATMLRACARRPGGAPESAVMAAATIAATPYVLDYDFTALLPALAFVAADAARTAWRPGEKLALAAVYLFPLVARNLSLWGVPLGPVVLGLCLVIVTRRARSW